MFVLIETRMDEKNGGEGVKKKIGTAEYGIRLPVGRQGFKNYRTQ